MVLMPLILLVVLPLLAPIIAMAVDLFEAILNPLIEAAMSNDQADGIFKGSFFGPYKDGMWPHQFDQMKTRAPALKLESYSKSQLKTAKSGGCSQLNALFYALFVMQIVQTLAAGITKGLLKFLVRPLTMLLKLMVPAEIGAFMIGKMPKLLAKPIVNAATHGVVHSVNHALGHGLSRSVTVAVVHSLSRSQTHYYYCLYCYYHGAYCQFCEFYNEYAQLGNKAKGWGQYKAKPDGGSPEGSTEYSRMTSEQKGKWNAAAPYEPHWSSEVACYSHYRPRGCQLPANPTPDTPELPKAERAVNTACTEQEYKEDHGQPKLFAQAAGFHDCRLSDMVQYFSEHATFCVLPPDEIDGLELGLRMRVRKLPPLSEATREPHAGAECDYDISTMGEGAAKFLGDEKDPKAKALRARAFRKCREKVEKMMVLAKYQRFYACVQELDSKK